MSECVCVQVTEVRRGGGGLFRSDDTTAPRSKCSSAIHYSYHMLTA